MYNYLMTKLETWALRRICKRIVIQSPDHMRNISNYYTIIHKAAIEEFTEESTVSLKDFMHDCFVDSLFDATGKITMSSTYEDLNLMLDWNIVDAIKNYFLYGLPPGSFTTLLLKGDYENAPNHAHPLIKQHIPDHIAFVEMLPGCCRGENFSNWQGAVCTNSEDITSIVLTGGVAARWYEQERKSK